MSTRYTPRRKDRISPETEALALLERCEWGTLSTLSPDGEPYGVPLSYVVSENQIFFHCALRGRKTDNLAFQPRASFCVVGKTQPVYTDNFSTYYESAIVFGTVRTVTDPQEVARALRLLAGKYLPDHLDKADGHIQKSASRTTVLSLSIDHVSGKSKRRP